MSEDKKSALSFGFAKRKDKSKVIKSALQEDVQKDAEERDFVLSFNEKEIHSTKPKEEKKEIIIPLITANRWRSPMDLEAEDDTESKKDDKEKERKWKADDIKDVNPESQAVREIMEESAAKQEEWDSRDKKKELDIDIPLLMRNKVPEGFETDDKLDVSLRPDEAADYDAVPIDAFGKAMLRGMGWKEGQGIGKNAKGAAKPIDAVLRPKGLGLGADRSQMKQKAAAQGGDKKADDKDEEELELRKGACCVVIGGKHKDLYGVVEGTDEDNARVMIKLTIGGERVTLSQFAVKLVSRKEYDKYSKYLNKGKSDKYKEEQARKLEESDRKKDRHRDRPRDRDGHHSRDENEEDRHSHKRRREAEEDSPHEHKRHRDRHDPDERHSNKDDRDTSKKHKSSKSHSSNGQSYNSQTKHWLRPHLRVRIVSSDYKKGKYFKSKVVIEDVISQDECICRSEEGRILEGLSQSHLETVIPKADNSYIMIVHGRHAGLLGQVLKRDKSTYLADIQLLREREKVLQLDFDTICEYTGDITEEFDY